MSFDVHIIGGGLAGSRSRLAARRGGPARAPERDARRRRHDAGARDRSPRRDGLLEQLPLRRRRAQCRRPAPPGNARARLADHARRATSTAFRPARRSPSTATAFAAEVTRAIEQHPNIAIVRERVDALPDHPTIIATGPLTGSALAEAIAAETGAGRPRLLRRHRADRPPRQHRHGRRLDGRALGQGRQGLHQLPARQGAVRGLRRGAASTARRPSSRSGRRTRPISKAACRSR